MEKDTRRGGPLFRMIEDHMRAAAIQWTRWRDGEVEDRPEMLLYCSRLPQPWTSGVMGATLRREEVDHAVEETRAWFDARNSPWTWWIGPLTEPLDLARTLEAHGFRREEDIPRFALELDDVELDASGSAELAIERVADDRTEAGWLEAMAGAWAEPEVTDTMRDLSRAAGFDPDGPWARFFGTLNGGPVSSSGLIVAAGVACVIGVATIPEARRRGIGEAMTRAALGEARRRGHRLAILGATEMSRGIYERMGFRFVCDTFGYAPEPKPEAGDPILDR
jgi:GNAT superfamily N-acetyltransferase